MTYADRLRSALKARGMFIRQLADAVGHSYEHCRKIVQGEPVVSQNLNASICKVLHLDETEMWQLAQREKAAERFGVASEMELDVAGKALLALWLRLSSPDKAILLRVAKGLYNERKRERGVSDRAWLQQKR